MDDGTAYPSSTLSPAVSRIVHWNTARIRRVERDAPNPCPIEDEAWTARVTAAHPTIRAEWDAFAGDGGRLPRLDEMFGGWQGNVNGSWMAGGMISRRRPCSPLAELFPETVAVLLTIPDLLSASWSVFGPRAELPVHQGMNAGAYNLLIGVRCPEESGHTIEDQPLWLEGGRVVLFDDTRPHAAWNRSDEPRVVIHGEVMRRVPGALGALNPLVQWASHWLTPSYRNAIETGAELHRALNG